MPQDRTDSRKYKKCTYRFLVAREGHLDALVRQPQGPQLVEVLPVEGGVQGPNHGCDLQRSAGSGLGSGSVAGLGSGSVAGSVAGLG